MKPVRIVIRTRAHAAVTMIVTSRNLSRMTYYGADLYVRYRGDVCRVLSIEMPTLCRDIPMALDESPSMQDIEDTFAVQIAMAIAA